MKEPSKIWIVGGMGGGKSTLAEWLGAITGCPVYDLDSLCYKDGIAGLVGKIHPYQDRQTLLSDIASSDYWIAEGIYIWWVRELAEKADVIIWFDMPLYLAWWRIIRRHIARSLAGTNKYKGILKLLIFLGWVVRYYKYNGPDPVQPYEYISPSRNATKRFLTPYRTKLVHLTSPRDVTKLIKGVRKERGTK